LPRVNPAYFAFRIHNAIPPHRETQEVPNFAGCHVRLDALGVRHGEIKNGALAGAEDGETAGRAPVKTLARDLQPTAISSFRSAFRIILWST